jgi:putative sterol carrier protein
MKILPTLVISFYFTMGNINRFAPEQMQWVTAVCSAILVLVLIYLGRRGEASPIDVSMSGYIFLGAIGFWLWPEGLTKLMAAYAAALLYLILFLVAIVPLLTSLPTFTEYFARKRTPKAVWETDIYKRINRNMTWVWAGIFTACGLSALIPALYPGLAGGFEGAVFEFVLPLAFLLGIGLPFTKKYPDFYQRKQGIEPVTAGAMSETPKEEIMSTSDSQTPTGPQSASNCKELLQMMPLGFNPQADPDLKAIIQFKIIEDEDFSAYLQISGGACTFHEGVAGDADLTITTPGSVWLAIAKGELDGQAAFMSGKYQVNGDLSLLMRMNLLFSRK